MCGPFIAFCVGADRNSPARHAAVQCAYHGGRLVSYALLGTIAGTLGAAANWGGQVLGFQKTAMIAAGAFMVLFGAIALARVLGLRIGAAGVPKPLAIAFGRAQAFVRDRDPVTRALVIGLLSILLPCGWLYFFVIASAATGGPLTGALAMSAFWLGTVPALAAIGIGVQTLFGPLRRHVPAAMACLLLIVGIFVTIRALEVDANAALPAVESEDLSAEAAKQMVGADGAEFVPPCCAGETEEASAQ
jgi:sulfite exporter TauE/SafE